MARDLRWGWVGLLAPAAAAAAVSACGTAQPFARGEFTPTPTAAPTPTEAPTPTAPEFTPTAPEFTPTAPEFTPTPSQGGDTPTPTEAPTPTPTPPSFNDQVKPALQPCTTCHASGAGGWTYDGGAGAYDAVLQQVDLEQPESSPLLIKTSGGGSHGGGAIYSTSSAEYQLILTWISAGAPNN